MLLKRLIFFLGKTKQNNLRNLRGQIGKDEADADVRKTLEVFNEIGAKDPEFLFKVHANLESWIKNLM